MKRKRGRVARPQTTRPGSEVKGAGARCVQRPHQMHYGRSNSATWGVIICGAGPRGRRGRAMPHFPHHRGHTMDIPRHACWRPGPRGSHRTSKKVQVPSWCAEARSEPPAAHAQLKPKSSASAQPMSRE